MGVLGPGLGLILAEGVGPVGGAVAAVDERTGGHLGLMGDAQRIGTHIGNEADRALAADVDALIELLRNRHRAARRHVQLARGLLLERRGDERRRRRAALFRALDVADREFLPLNVRKQLVDLLLVGKLALLAVAVIARGKAAGLVHAAQEHVERPVFLRNKGLDLALALHDEARRDGLHASGGQAAPDLLPEQRAELIADDAVEHAARLLCVDKVIVDVARLCDALRDDLFRDLVEGHAVGLVVRQSQQHLQVP